MDLALFAVNDGYSEAVIRGLRSNFLNEATYNQMKNCSSITELKSVINKSYYKAIRRNRLCSLFTRRTTQYISKRVKIQT
jgi:vacuolar-type H+-ATPase subunit C/Vma6